MAKRVAVLSVFVASPDDVSQEREALEDVIRELNALWKASKGIQLDLVRWETHAYPSVGEDPQAVVNEQIGDDYDIFIGMLWKKFGTPTGRAASGTEEEFNRAYQRYKEDPQSLRIMFYFRSGQVDLQEVDPEQLLLVRNFQKKIREKGTLYWEYRNREEFSRLVRMHLSRHVEDWGKKWGAADDGSAEQSVAASIVKEKASPHQDAQQVEEEEGFLDLVETGTESFESLQDLTQRMGASIESLGKKSSVRTEDLKKAQAGSGKFNLKAIKRICNQAADDLEQFAKVMEVEIPIFGDTFAKGIDAYAKAASQLPDFAAQGEDIAEPLANAIETVSHLQQIMREVSPNMLGLRSSIADTPRMTTLYNRAKRRAVAAVDRLIAEVDSALNQLKEAKRVLEELQESAGGDGT